MTIEKMDRKALLRELSNYRFVPGHGPNFEERTDDELREILKTFQTAFEDAFRDTQSKVNKEK